MLTYNMTPVTALSPLDGRYAAKLATLRPLMSEQGYMHRRVQVELTWFAALSDAGFAEFTPLSADARKYLVALVTHFSTEDALAVKEIEKKPTTMSKRSSIGSKTNLKHAQMPLLKKN